MSSKREPTPVEKAIGWVFQDASLLEVALTHSTFANETALPCAHYERLEFLGDAVLDLLVARLLYGVLPQADEGELSRGRAAIVCSESLARMAAQIQLGQYIRFGEGQRRSNAPVSPRILADCFEALVGAVFVDGGYAAVESAFGPALAAAIAQAGRQVDYKTRLQEVCYQQFAAAPHYVVVAVEGPDHARRYSCAVEINAVVRGRGEASSKKAAEQACAREALLALGVITDNL